MRILLATIVAVMLVTDACGQSASDLARRQKELRSIRDQIKKMEIQIGDQQKKEKTSLELLDTYDRKAGLVRRLIDKLRVEEKYLELRIDTSKATIAALEAQYGFLKEQYARYVRAAYKSGPIQELELLWSSRSLNQYSIRNEYLKRFTRQRKRDADVLVSRKRDLEETQARLQIQLSDQQQLIGEKGEEEHRLASLAADRRTMVARIRSDVKMLRRSVDRQTQAAKDLESLVARLIEAERIKKEREARANAEARLPQPPPTASDFPARRGNLRWPVAQGSVVAHFGAQKHPRLKTITQNTGIDIAVKAGSAVSAVADGEVATIWWLPSFGNLVILNHYGGYRTVYAHLDDIKVAEGQRIKEGDVIAESGEAVDGPRLHFEVWKDHEKQNPEIWLSRQ